MKDAIARLRAARSLQRRGIALPRSLYLPKAMASPPTVTTSGAATLTQIIHATNSGGVNYSSGMTSSRFTLSGAKFNAAAADSTSGMPITPHITTGTGSTPVNTSCFTISFFHDGANLEILTKGSADGLLIKVDGEFVSLTPQSVSASPTLTAVKLAFGSRAFRRIDVVGGSGNGWGFAGIACDATDGIFPASRRGPRVICFGDSFTQGALEGWPTWFGHAMGWDDVWFAGVGGTGYVATNSGAAKKFRDRLATDVIAFEPDVVLVLGSLNDWGQNKATVQSEAQAVAQTIKAGLPNALVIGSNNTNGGVEKWNHAALEVRDATKAGFIAGGGTWLDITEMPMQGTPAVATAGATLSAGRTGSSGIQPAIGTGPAGFHVGDTVELGTTAGGNRERVCITSETVVSSYRVYQFQGALQYTHASGEAMTVVGPCYTTGIGKVGSTTGVGTADLWLSSDGTHQQKPAGMRALGIAWASLVHNWANGLTAAQRAAMGVTIAA